MTAPEQVKNLGSAWVELRAARLHLDQPVVADEPVGRIAGHDLKSTKELSLGEAASIIRHLDQLDRVGELRLLADQYAPGVTS